MAVGDTDEDAGTDIRLVGRALAVSTGLPLVPRAKSEAAVGVTVEDDRL